MSDLRTDTPTFTRELAAAVRFLDAFTGQPVRTPLAVSIPSLNWAASWTASDATYRFSLVNPPRVGGLPQLPAGVFDLAVAPPGDPPSTTPTGSALLRGPYAALETRQLTLPPVVHSPPLATDFRVDLTLWPTVAFRPPPGETAIEGSVVSVSHQNIVGLKVILLDAAAPPPANPPYTRTDGAGQFIFRFPSLRRGTVYDPMATLNVRLFDIADTALAAAPASLTVPIGRVTNFVKLNIA